MIDPTSRVGEETEEAAPACAACEAKIINESTHRVRTRVEDGGVETTHFCDEECLSAFEE